VGAASIGAAWELELRMEAARRKFDFYCQILFFLKWELRQNLIFYVKFSARIVPGAVKI
jgi:uncharacterized membrane protein